MKYTNLILIATFLFSCETDEKKPLITETNGIWGGDGIIINASNTITTFEFDCAHAYINDRLEPNVGHYGIYVFEKGGPIIINEKEDAHPALIKNEILDKDEIEIVISILDKETPNLRFKAKKNVQGILKKCL